MSIEVKELHIKAVVAPEPAPRNDKPAAAMLEKMKKDILKECIQEIKAIMNEQKER
ncbi:DUF5908 family protein [Paraflavitalea soli]|jgi:hypothetical protein|uniref:DUF5908 family protein n=1 Tax=Paraflavitalea soli TaxID=2315862 RepID=UPI0013C4D2B9|nr:DUF5908 family protein [Paraflavitalea soli]